MGQSLLSCPCCCSPSKCGKIPGQSVGGLEVGTHRPQSGPASSEPPAQLSPPDLPTGWGALGQLLARGYSALLCQVVLYVWGLHGEGGATVAGAGSLTVGPQQSLRRRDEAPLPHSLDLPRDGGEHPLCVLPSCLVCHLLEGTHLPAFLLKVAKLVLSTVTCPGPQDRRAPGNGRVSRAVPDLPAKGGEQRWVLGFLQGVSNLLSC